VIILEEHLLPLDQNSNTTHACIAHLCLSVHFVNSSIIKANALRFATLRTTRSPTHYTLLTCTSTVKSDSHVAQSHLGTSLPLCAGFQIPLTAWRAAPCAPGRQPHSSKPSIPVPDVWRSCGPVVTGCRTPCFGAIARTSSSVAVR
jgi:hypothetical protein